VSTPSTTARPIVLGIPPVLYPESPQIGESTLRVIDAAAAAGFDGVAISTSHPQWGVVAAAEAEVFFDGLSDVRLPILGSEVINVDLWGVRDRAADREASAQMLDLSARAGAPAVIVMTLETELPPWGAAPRGHAVICYLGPDRGLRINFEFMPWTAVPDLATAARLVEATDRDNLGIVFDIWHWSRAPGGPDLAALRALPADWIQVLQLNDVVAVPGDDVIDETVRLRQLPGHGVADIMGVLAALDHIGATPTLASEVFSEELGALGWAESTRRQCAAIRTLLQRYEASRAPVDVGPRTMDVDGVA
jgi:sugar phosphate isomerase/epimerase